MILEGTKVSKYFGGIHALENVDFSVEEETITGLIGPNGSGKTTLFNVISGLHRPTTGEIRFAGKKITGLKPHEITKLGIARTYQIPRPFLNLSVFENVLTAALFGSVHNAGVRDARCKVENILKLISLTHKKDVLAKKLTLAERKRLELARALGCDPKLLLLDEPFSGLTPVEVDSFIELIKKIKSEFGVTILLIEHVMKAVMGLADFVIVLHNGRKIAEGLPKNIANDEKVIEAYLGRKYAF